MSIKSLLSPIWAYVMAYVVAPIMSFFDRGLDSLLADMTKLDAKLDAFLDREAVKRQKLMAERAALRDRIEQLWNKHDASEAAADRAGRIQTRIRDLIQ